MAAELEQLRVSLVAELVGREAFEQLKREVNQVKAATAGLDTAQTKLKNTVSDSEKAIRQQRQAFSQGGMQINQFMGQVTAGTPVMTALVQQLGDITYVMGQAEGAFGKFGRFLAGPWGATILVAISVLGPLIAKLLESKDAAEKAQSAFAKYMNGIAAASAVADAFTESSVAIAGAKGELAKLNAEQKRLEKSRPEFKGEAAYAAAVAARDSRLAAIQERKAKLTKIIQDGEANIAAVKTQQLLIQQRQDKLDAAREARINSEKAAKTQVTAMKRAQKEAEKIAKEREMIALETRLIMTKGAQEFESSMKKMGDVAGKEIDKFLSDDIKNSISGMSNLFDEIKTQVDEVVYQGADKVQGLAQAMGESFSAGIKGMITGAMTFKQVMSNVIDSVISKLFEMFVVQQIVGMIGKGISAITGITLPVKGAKAIGGPVQAGSAYMVGERGPEMFVPSRSGSIVPNGGASGMTINVDARGSADPAAVRAQVELGIAQAAPYIIAAAQNRTMKTAGRARLPGTIG